MSRSIVEIEGRELALTNLEKDLYPPHGFTKARVLEYYGRIAPYMLPHLKDRALTLTRFPDGASADSFFEKRCPERRPAWLETAEVRRGAGRLTACLANDLAALLWLGNLAALELHVPLARAGSPGAPDSLVFDLDPGDGADALACARVAFLLKDLLAGLKLESLVKTSGKKGLHVCVPLDPGGTDFEGTKAFSRAAALLLQKNYPALVTEKMAKETRKGKVFINWAQNDASKTMICVYSLRAGPEPAVSCPLDWEELKELAALKKPENFKFTPEEAVKRAGKRGDLFRDLLAKKQRLPSL